MVESIKEKLRKVRCYHSANEIEIVVQQAKDNQISYFEFIENLLNNEIRNRQKNRLKRYLKMSRFPQIKTIEGFDFHFQTSVTKRIANEWFVFDWIEQRQNKIFMGPPGVGKTHLALSIGYSAIMNHYKVVFYTMQDLMEEMIIAEDEKVFDTFLKKLLKNDLIIIDELGYLPLKLIYSNLFFQLINQCYEYRSVIITSNKFYKEWGNLFGNQTMAGAILDRLLHHAESVILNGDSYRLRDVKGNMFKEKQHPEMSYSSPATPSFHSTSLNSSPINLQATLTPKMKINQQNMLTTKTS